MDKLTLKWGTLKGWKIESEAATVAFKKLAALGLRSVSVMMQEDTQEEKLALCNLIDAIEGDIWSDWTGKKMSKKQAKKYVMEYNKNV